MLDSGFVERRCCRSGDDVIVPGGGPDKDDLLPALPEDSRWGCDLDNASPSEGSPYMDFLFLLLHKNRNVLLFLFF